MPHGVRDDLSRNIPARQIYIYSIAHDIGEIRCWPVNCEMRVEFNLGVPNLHLKGVLVG